MSLLRCASCCIVSQCLNEDVSRPSLLFPCAGCPWGSLSSDSPWPCPLLLLCVCMRLSSYVVYPSLLSCALLPHCLNEDMALPSCGLSFVLVVRLYHPSKTCFRLTRRGHALVHLYVPVSLRCLSFLCYFIFSTRTRLLFLRAAVRRREPDATADGDAPPAKRAP